MRTVVSLRSFSLAFATTLGLGGGLSGCSGTHRAGTESDGGPSTGGANTGGSSSGGASTGGSSTGGTAGGGFPFPCTNPTPVLDANGRPTSIENCASGGSHRVEPVECSITAPRQATACMSAGGLGDECSTDANCAARPYGFCGVLGQVGTCACSYGCRTDADCGSTDVCICGDPVGLCQAATCRSDADCGAGLECRSFQNPTSALCYDLRFECQHPDDECSSNADCSSATAGQGYCIADAAGVHRCTQTFSCAVPGRPFLINGAAVTAQLTRRRDWTELDVLAATQDNRELEGSLRERAARYWARAALLEHASIAAFSRFILQLLSLGAPADLVERAQRALADEIAHARVCFALSSSYGASLVGPGPLPVGDCLGACDLETVTRLVVREGCIGETLAAIEAAEALGHARNEPVQKALERIVADETSHAELAWRFVRWALERDPSLASAISSELSAEERKRGTAHVTTDELSEASAALAAHGVLPEAHSACLAARSVREVVRPLLEQLLEESRPRLAA